MRWVGAMLGTAAANLFIGFPAHSAISPYIRDDAPVPDRVGAVEGCSYAMSPT
jgi:hypothetical protein